MATGIANSMRQFRRIGLGKESTYGTAVNPTRQQRIIDLSWKDQAANRLYTPDYSVGRLTRRTDVPTVTRTGLADSSFGTDFSFEDILFPLLAGFKGGVVASAEKTVGQGDREWVFQNDPNTGDPLPDSYTLYRRFTNGTTKWDRTAPGVIVESFTISADGQGDVTKLTVNFWSRAASDSTGGQTTAIDALTLQTPFTMLPALSWQFGLNNTWAAMDVLGAAPTYGVGTAISTTVRSFTYTYFTGLTPALFIGDGRTDPSKHRFGPRGSELTLECEFNATVNTEIGLAGSGTKRYIRLLGEDGQIGTGYRKTMLIQGAFVYPEGLGEDGGEADGADTKTLKLESLPDDDTEDNEIRVINTLSTFP